MQTHTIPVDEYYSDDFTMAATIVELKYTNFAPENASCVFNSANSNRQLFQLTLKNKEKGETVYLCDKELFGLLAKAMQFVSLPANNRGNL